MLKKILISFFLLTTAATSATLVANKDIASNAAIAWSKMAALTVSKVACTDSSGNVTACSMSSAFLDATSSIQTQLNGKASSSASTTVAGQSCALGGSCSIAAANLSNGVTGSGNVVLASTPTLTTPILGVATAASLNGMGMSCSATTCTFQITSGKSFTVSNSLQLTGTDGSTVAFGAGGTVAYLASPAFTGTPSLPTGTTGVTQSANDNSTKLATTAYSDLKLPKAGGTMTGLLTVKEVKETVVAGGTCSTSYNVDPTAGSMITLTLSGACAIGVTNLAAGHSFTIYLTQSSTTAPTFTSAYKWQAATVPTFSTSATKYDTIACGSPDGSKVICGAIVDAR